MFDLAWKILYQLSYLLNMLFNLLITMTLLNYCLNRHTLLYYISLSNKVANLSQIGSTVLESQICVHIQDIVL